MRSAHRPTAMWLVVMLLTAIVLPATVLPAAVRADDDTMVAFAPETTNTTVGQEIEVEVRIEDVENLYGVDLRVGFDPDLLEVVDVNPDEDGTQVAEGEFLHGDIVAKNEVDAELGMIWYGATQISPRAPVSGDGTVLVLRFRALAAGTAFLTWDRVDLANVESWLLDTDVRGGQIIISSASGDTPVPPDATPTWTITPSPTLWPSRTPSPIPTMPVPTVDVFSSPTPTGDVTETPWIIPSSTSTKTRTPTATHTAATSAATATGDAAAAGTTTSQPTSTPAASATVESTDPYAGPTQPAAAPTRSPLPTSDPGAETQPEGAETPTSAPGVTGQAPTQPDEPGSEGQPGPTSAEPTVDTAGPEQATPTAAAAVAPGGPQPTVPKLAFAVPTVEGTQLASDGTEESRSLVPNGLFICSSAGLGVFTLALFLYLRHRARIGASRSTH